MNSFEKLLANSTNRFSAAKNIVLSNISDSKISRSTNIQSFTPPLKNTFFKASCAQEVAMESFEQLQQRYRQLTKTIKQASQQKQAMTILLKKITNLEEGRDQSLRKRFRRKKNQINSKFYCELGNCNKIYSSSASLVRHTKLKHAHKDLQPPSHNYLIPPSSPNLKKCTQCELNKKGEQFTLQNAEPEDEEGDSCSHDNYQQDQFSQENCESSIDQSQKLRKS